ncbi:uncharacterized protein [Haliotis asinina]|uniref:uncharacterized protein n=1 Tax=Haliotis asinina TaxID=109174 RepID=UPI003531B4C9
MEDMVASPLTDLPLPETGQQLRNYVCGILPNLEETVLKNLMLKLEKLGVECIADLSFIEENDLDDILTPIAIRRLMCNIRRTTHSQGSIAPPPSSASSSTCSTTSPPPSPIHIEIGNRDLTWASKFQFQWDRLPGDILGCLRTNQRLTGGIRLRFVRGIVDQVRQINRRPTKRHLEVVAQRLVDMYPESLQDRIENDVVGTGYDSLMMQFVNRNDNLNRNSSNLCLSQTSKRKLSGSDTDHSEGTEKQKNCPRDAYGCANWSPPITDVTSAESARDDLKRIHKEDPGRWSWDTIEGLILKSYPLQRATINDAKPVIELMEMWPFLFEVRGMLIHVNELLGINVKDAVYNALLDKAPRLKCFFRSALSSIKDKAEALFQEADRQSKIDNVKDTANKKETEAACQKNYPHLAVYGPTILASTSYSLIVDGTVVTDRIPGFGLALTALFSSYYVLNIEYPAEAGPLLEFIQRYAKEIGYRDTILKMCSLYEMILTETEMQTLMSRIRCRINIGGPDSQCQLWEGSVDKDGYPVLNTTLRTKRMRLRANRAWYFLHNLKEFRDDLTVSHLCHFKLCMNLSHLALEPSGINTQRKTCVDERRCFHHCHYKDCLGFPE